MQSAENVRQKVLKQKRKDTPEGEWMRKIELLFMGDCFSPLTKRGLYFRHSRRCRKFSRIKVCVVLLGWNGGETHQDLVPQASQDTRGGDLPESLNWGPSFLKTLHHPSHPKFIRVICLLLLFCMHSTGSRARWESPKLYWPFSPSLSITFKHWTLQSVGYPSARPIRALKKTQ